MATVKAAAPKASFEFDTSKFGFDASKFGFDTSKFGDVAEHGKQNLKPMWLRSPPLRPAPRS